MGVQSIYTRECVFGEIRTGLTVIITNIHQSVGTTPDVKFRWMERVCASEGEVEGIWRESDCHGFYALAGGRTGGGRRHVVLVVRALFFAFCFLHLTLQLHFAFAYTHTHIHTCINIFILYIHAVFYAYVIYLKMSSTMNFYILTRNQCF